MREHTPVLIENFNGLFDNGQMDSVPIDHFSDCQNLEYVQSGFQSRDGIDVYFPIANPIRVYTFVKSNSESLIILDRSGQFWDTDYSGSPILTIIGATDFAFKSINGRGYISPHDGTRGLSGEKVYVYLGDGTAARAMAGNVPTQTSTVKQFYALPSATSGVVTAGQHLIAIAYKDSSGNYSLLGPEAYAFVAVDGTKSIDLFNIPVGPSGIIERLLVMTKNIAPFGGDQTAYSYWVVQSIPDNTTTSLTFSIADASLTSAPFLNGIPAAPTYNGAFYAKNDSVDSLVDSGTHLFAVVYETSTGFLTSPGPNNFAVLNQAGNKQIRLTNIPTGSSSVVARWIIATKLIGSYNGDQNRSGWWFVKRIADNTTTSYAVSFFDADLTSSADYLFDLLAAPPAGVFLSIYHNRLVIGGEYTNPTIARLSNSGEPESFDAVDGILDTINDGLYLTNAQEFRDVLYLFKQTKTRAFSDNGDVPSSWGEGFSIDEGIGTFPHGIATVLDSGGVSIEFLLILSYSGLLLFNGSFVRPELTWKIKDLWEAIVSTQFLKMQIMHDSIRKRIYISNYVTQKLLLLDYFNGLDSQAIRISPWKFDVECSSITLTNRNALIIASEAQ